MLINEPIRFSDLLHYCPHRPSMCTCWHAGVLGGDGGGRGRWGWGGGGNIIQQSLEAPFIAGGFIYFYVGSVYMRLGCVTV